MREYEREKEKENKGEAILKTQTKRNDYHWTPAS